MTLKKQWIINIIMVFFSWGSFQLPDRKHMKRFLPASILIVIFEALSVQYAKKRKWWIFYHKPKSYVSGEFAFNIGPFLALAFWTLKWSYGNFYKFILYNGVVHAFFSTVVIQVLDKLRIAKLKRINHLQFFFYFFYKAFILYGIQFMIEKMRVR